MNTKVVIGAFIAVVVVLGGYYFLGGAGGPAGPDATSTPSGANASSTAPAGLNSSEFPLPGATGSSGAGAPGMVEGVPVKTITHITLAFDGPTFTSTSTYPMLSGTGGNVSKAQIEIEDAAGKGLVASDVAIVNGRWTYSSPIALAPGTYTVLLGTQGLIVKAKLVISST